MPPKVRIFYPLIGFFATLIAGVLLFRLLPEWFFVFWLPLGVIVGLIGFLVSKIENECLRRKSTYALVGAWLGLIPSVLKFFYVWASLTVEMTLLYKGFVFAIVSSTLFFLIAHLEYRSVRIVVLIVLIFSGLVSHMLF